MHSSATLIKGKMKETSKNAPVCERMESGEGQECCWKPQTIRPPLAPLALKAVKDTWDYLLLHPPIRRIDFWARVCSPGSLMADKAGANGNTIHADEQPPRSGTERKRKGSGKEKGSVESGTRWKQLLLKHRFKNDHGWRCKRTKGEREDDIEVKMKKMESERMEMNA